MPCCLYAPEMLDVLIHSLQGSTAAFMTGPKVTAVTTAPEGLVLISPGRAGQDRFLQAEYLARK